MKKNLTLSVGKAARKAILYFGLTSVMAVSFLPSAVHAQDKEKPAPTGVEIRYIGSVDEKPVFQIEFENNTEEVFNVSIKDEEGVVLYKERFKDKKFSRKFQFEKADMDHVKLTFTLTGEKEKQSQAFEINTNVRVIQDVVITKL